MSVLLQTFLVGLFTILFFMAMNVLWRRRRSRAFDRPMFVAAIIMFVAVHLHTILHIARVVDAFITYRDAGLTLAVLEDQTNWKRLAKNGFLNVQLAVGDAVVTYRAWLIWRSWKIIALPFLLVIASIVTGTLLVFKLHALGNVDPVYAGSLHAWVYSELTVVFCNNLLCTGLISYKILSVELGGKQARRATYSPLRPLVRIFSESGILAATTSMVALILHVLRSNAQSIVFDALSPVTGIAFMLIVVRSATEIPLCIVNSGTRHPKGSTIKTFTSLGELDNIDSLSYLPTTTSGMHSFRRSSLDETKLKHNVEVVRDSTVR